jgi:hypothetical protein
MNQGYLYPTNFSVFVYFRWRVRQQVNVLSGLEVLVLRRIFQLKNITETAKLVSCSYNYVMSRHDAGMK